MAPDKPSVSRRALRIAAATGAVIAATVVIVGVTNRKNADAHLSEWTEQQATPVVAVEKPSSRSSQATIELPGRLEAYSQAQIFARVSGYIKSWTTDIGTPVKAGQLLAEIDAPDLDQQIMQAEADLASAQANVALSKATLERGQNLIASGSVSKQDMDQRGADFASKQALVRSAQANLDRLRVLEKYKRITAPFDGLVTVRAVDFGMLINAGAGGGPALFVISDTRKLRVYVDVPQHDVPSVRIGTQARISVPEYPGRTFPVTVQASARAVDAASGTTRMLLVVDNASGELMTGAFARVQLDLPAPENSISIPASALIFTPAGLQVATVDTDSRILLKPVVIARDFGDQVEIGSGLSSTDRIVTTPPDGIATGDKVRIAGAADEAAAAPMSTSEMTPTRPVP